MVADEFGGVGELVAVEPCGEEAVRAAFEEVSFADQALRIATAVSAYALSPLTWWRRPFWYAAWMSL